jgi:hypothetical protein
MAGGQDLGAVCRVVRRISVDSVVAERFHKTPAISGRFCSFLLVVVGPTLRFQDLDGTQRNGRYGYGSLR